MAVLAVAALGSAIGSATLGAGIFGISGASIGWLAGSVIGQSLFGPSIEGPKLSDKKVQISSYGAPIPNTYGGVRVAGNVFWSTDLVEHKRKEGGKGGPKVTKYSYSVSCAAMLSGSQVESIRRIWADSKCVYDAREDAPKETQAASAKFRKYFVLYHGDETQLPDPTIEAADGAGNVPAYRGIAYVVFTDLPLDDYGNRIPNFTFEISNQPEGSSDEVKRTPLIIYPWELNATGRPVHRYGAPMEFKEALDDGGSSWGDDYATALAANNNYLYTHGGYGYGINGMDNATEFLGYRSSINDRISQYSGGAKVSSHLRGSEEWVEYRHCAIKPDIYSAAPYDVALYTKEALAAGCLPGNGRIAYVTSTDLAISGLASFAASLCQIIPFADWTYGSWPNHGFINNGGGPAVEDPRTGGPGGGAYFPVVAGPRLTALRALRTPTVPLATCFLGDDPCVDGLAQIPDDPDYCIACDGTISFNYSWHLETGTAKQLCAIEFRDGVMYQQALAPVLLPDDPDYDNADFWDAAAAAAIADGTMQSDVDYPVVVTEWAESEPLNNTLVGAGFIQLSEIVRDQCLRAGLTDYQIDVSELTDIVLGYTVGRQGSARQAIDQLRTAYFFDAVESGDIIKFVKRGHEPVATITADDLGASEDGGAVLMDHQRRQETELPATVNVVYSARSADYQNGTQISKRLTTRSEQEVTVELGIVLGDTKALQVADALLYDTWASRTSRTLKVPRKWAHIEPTDVLLVEDNEGFTYRLFVKDKTEDGGVITLECQDQDQSAYVPPDGFDPDDPDNSNIVPSNPGPTTPGSGSPVAYPGPTKLLLMDIPALRQADAQQGYYVAAAGYRPEWRGAFVYRSDDAGATYLEQAELTNAVTTGYARTTLADFDGGNIVDEVNSVEVRMHTGSLSTITRAQLLNNGNVALLGQEILQFMRAELISSGRYRLSGLLRGRLGTEQHIGTHDIDDIFVLLEASKVARISEDASFLEVPALYKGVTYGDPLTSAVPIEFTDTGASLKALAPVHVTAGALGGGMYRVQWTRRTRYGGEWLDFADVPLDMTEEAYFVYVRRLGVGVARARVVGVQTADVPAQPGDVIEVSQISDRISLGFAATITVA